MFSFESKTDQHVERNSVPGIRELDQHLQSPRANCLNDVESIRPWFQSPADFQNLFNSPHPFKSLIFPYFYGRTVNVPPPPYNSSHENEAIDLDKNAANSKLMKSETHSATDVSALIRPNCSALHCYFRFQHQSKLSANQYSKFKIQKLPKTPFFKAFQSISKNKIWDESSLQFSESFSAPVKKTVMNFTF